jgi:hypothetical protein
MSPFLIMSTLDMDGWLRGLLSAGISGGASAITGGIVVSGLDPEHYSFQAGKFWILVGTLFMANAVVSMAKFLQSQPLPGVKTVTTSVAMVEPGHPSVITTVAESHIEPMVPPPAKTNGENKKGS